MNYDEIINGLKSRLITEIEDFHGDLEKVHYDDRHFFFMFSDGRWAVVSGNDLCDNAFDWHPMDLFDGGVIDRPAYELLRQEQDNKEDARQRENELWQLARLKEKYEKT